MELIRTWILSVTVSAMVIAMAEGLMPAGTVRKVAKLTGGLVLMLGVLQPLVRMDYDELFLAANGFSDVVVESKEIQQASSSGFLKSIIEQEVSAYVLDKAQTLGFSCEVSITCELGENDVPYPAQAVISGLSNESQQRAMRQLLRDELGIPDEMQTYIGGEEP